MLPGERITSDTAPGELALDGRITAVAGVLPSAVAMRAAGRAPICPAAQGGEAAWPEGLDLLAPASLLALINRFKRTQVLSLPTPALEALDERDLDLADIKGLTSRG